MAHVLGTSVTEVARDGKFMGADWRTRGFDEARERENVATLHSFA